LGGRGRGLKGLKLKEAPIMVYIAKRQVKTPVDAKQVGEVRKRAALKRCANWNSFSNIPSTLWLSFTMWADSNI
jgi:hypothetical protein